MPSPAPSGFQVVRGDVLDAPALQKAMAGSDFVFHFQANADVREGKQKTRVDLEQNTLATWNVLEAMRVNEVKNIAFASSAAVYGEPEVFPTPESHALLQTSLYGASKLAGEAMIQAYSEYFGIHSFSYRFVSWIGERYTHGIVFDVMKKLRADSTRLPLLGDGTQKKSYLYVKDGVSGVMLGIENAVAQKNVYNLGHDEFIDVVEGCLHHPRRAQAERSETRFRRRQTGLARRQPAGAPGYHADQIAGLAPGRIHRGRSPADGALSPATAASPARAEVTAG